MDQTAPRRYVPTNAQKDRTRGRNHQAALLVLRANIKTLLELARVCRQNRVAIPPPLVQRQHALVSVKLELIQDQEDLPVQLVKQAV